MTSVFKNNHQSLYLVPHDQEQCLYQTRSRLVFGKNNLDINKVLL